jgi:hypothetical protein
MGRSGRSAAFCSYSHTLPSASSIREPELLDALVAGVGDVENAAAVYRDTVRAHAPHGDPHQQLAGEREALDAVVEATAIGLLVVARRRVRTAAPAQGAFGGVDPLTRPLGTAVISVGLLGPELPVSVAVSRNSITRVIDR